MENKCIKNTSFKISDYINFLKYIKGKYDLIGYKNIDFKKNFFLLRHDVDFSLEKSLEIAKIENKHNIKSTFFINLHSRFYNLLEPNQNSIIKEIINLKHDIGIHIDSEFYEIDSKDKLIKSLKKEKELFKKVFNIDVYAFSFHNPSEFHLSLDEYKYAKLTNCYSKKIRQSSNYISDSNGFIKYKKLEDFIIENNHKSFQILIHPGWWHTFKEEPYEKVFKNSYKRLRNQLKYQENYKGDLNDNEYYGEIYHLEFLRKIDYETYYLLLYLFYFKKYKSFFLELSLFIRNDLIKISQEFIEKISKNNKTKFIHQSCKDKHLINIIDLFDIITDNFTQTKFSRNDINIFLNLDKSNYYIFDKYSNKEIIKKTKEISESYIIIRNYFKNKLKLYSSKKNNLYKKLIQYYK